MDTYLDNNATTKPSPEVVEAMQRMLADSWANPSSVHRFGQEARRAVERARAEVCQLIHCDEQELIFTSGATESANMAIRGLTAAKPARKTIISCGLEHSAVRQTSERLGNTGHRLVQLRSDINGLIAPDSLAEVLQSSGDDVALVALHWINNETGVIQPIEQISELCRAAGVPLFVDATQAVGKVGCDVRSLGAAAVAFSGHKFHGPKGIGGLFVAAGTPLVPQTLGGPHERERRGGTENSPGIVGLGVAARLAEEFLASDGAERGRQQRDRLEQSILSTVDGSVGISTDAPRIWNTTNIAFPPLASEAILLLLSERGVSAAAGAACSSGSVEPSPVLLAQGIPEPVAHGAIRLSLCRETTDAEIDFALSIIPGAIEKLRTSMTV
jgi:cysteine desulfurase